MSKYEDCDLTRFYNAYKAVGAAKMACVNVKHSKSPTHEDSAVELVIAGDYTGIYILAFDEDGKLLRQDMFGL